MNLPIVNHPEYVAKINENSIFPIKTVNGLWYDIDTFKEYVLLKKQYEKL